MFETRELNLTSTIMLSIRLSEIAMIAKAPKNRKQLSAL